MCYVVIILHCYYYYKYYLISLNFATISSKQQMFIIVVELSKRHGIPLSMCSEENVVNDAWLLQLPHYVPPQQLPNEEVVLIKLNFFFICLHTFQ